MGIFKKNNNNHLTNIIYANIIVFIIINIYYIIYFLFQKDANIIAYLGLSSDLNIFMSKPWTIVTYMFVHEDLFHLLINLCWLYFGGNIFTKYLRNKELVSTYIMGGIVGALVYIISFNVFPVFEDVKMDSLAIGSSASVLAILFAVTTHIPNFPINIILINRMKLKHIAIMAILIDILSIPNGNAGGHLAHLGGALYGFLYIYCKKRNINTNYMVDKIIYSFKKKDPIFSYSRKENDYEYNSRKNEEQKKTNKILDKISKSGYNSLSKEEKEFLFNQK